jgi:hypothetical protein
VEYVVLRLLWRACLPAAFYAQSALPDPSRTPGAVNLAVGQATIGDTICVPGWTRTVRPPVYYTEDLKRRQIGAFGYSDHRLGHYQEDHLVPLELGGDPADPRNLWPEPKEAPDGWGIDRKDELQGVLNRRVCTGQLPLVEAQRAIAADWIAAYRRYVTGGSSGRSEGGSLAGSSALIISVGSGFWFGGLGNREIAIALVNTPATGGARYCQ